MTVQRETEQVISPERHDRRIVSRLGAVAVSLALICAVATLLIFADYTPISPTNEVVVSLLLTNAALVFILILFLVAEFWRLIAARRAQAAGSGVHIRMVALFSCIAAFPALLIAFVGSVTLDRTLNPAFLQDVRGFIQNTSEVARVFREAQCRSLLQEASLTATDLDRVNPLYQSNKALFRDFFSARARTLGFSTAVMMRRDGTVTEYGTGPDSRVVTPEPTDFDDAAKDEPLCLILDEGKTFVALRKMESFPDSFMYVARGIDPLANEFPAQASNLNILYNAYDAHRRNIQIAFAAMFVTVALITLLSATWLGLSFANRLVMPIRRLITATDQVSEGNLYVQVPVNSRDGDLGHLGETFNKMTSELRLQQNSLMAASRLNDERRVFTEAVLSGVPAGVIGVDAAGNILVLNSYATRFIGDGEETDTTAVVGQPIATVIPELADAVTAALHGPLRNYQGQISMSRRGRERTINVRVTSEQKGEGAGNHVITLDDITDLVTAQRTSAWADVARRIAHEIKNPLTPIQLSAERLQRKYGKVIVEDRAVFDQCTATIVRQVDDIKRMVDEFSSFARMPKARLQMDDLGECVRQVLFLMRVGHPDIELVEEVPAQPLNVHFDRRLLSQALTNIVKNATEGIGAMEENKPEKPRILVRLARDADDVIAIDIIDNGKGFPRENRQRLLEPYMTTRAEGTGLGLPIVGKIMEDHGGGIELLDAPEGQGAWVRLYFREAEAAAKSEDSEVAPEKTRASP